MVVRRPCDSVLFLQKLRLNEALADDGVSKGSSFMFRVRSSKVRSAKFLFRVGACEFVDRCLKAGSPALRHRCLVLMTKNSAMESILPIMQSRLQKTEAYNN